MVRPIKESSVRPIQVQLLADLTVKKENLQRQERPIKENFWPMQETQGEADLGEQCAANLGSVIGRFDSKK